MSTSFFLTVKCDVGSVQLYFSIVVMLLMSLITYQANDGLMEEEADIERSLSSIVHRLHGRGAQEGDIVCGRPKVIFTSRSHRNNRFIDAYGNSADDFHDALHLDKILGGNYVTYGEIPWQASILYNNQHICGGAIISEFWVISAAHCFFDWEVNTFGVVVGDHRLWFQDAREQVHNVSEIFIHDQYRLNQNDYDIALVKIKASSDGRGIRFNDNVQPICLANETEAPNVNTPMTFTGWGWTSEGSGKSEILKKVILPVIPYDRCEHLFSKAASKNAFCAGFINGDNDLCQGDSGGPAAYRSRESYILFGIAVFNSGCAPPNYPNGFSSIPAYRYWIDSTISNNSDGREGVMPIRGSSGVIVPSPDI